MRILFEPGVSGAAGGGKGNELPNGVAEPEIMDEVLVKLGLPKALAGGEGKKSHEEAQKAQNRKAAKPDEQENAEGTEKKAKTEEARVTELTPELAEAGTPSPELEAAQGELTEAQAELARLEEEGASAEDVDAARALVEEAEARVTELTPEPTEAGTPSAELEAAQAELETVRTEAETAKARVKDLETQLAAAGTKAIEVAPIHPAFLVDDGAKLEEMERELARFEQWALQNFDGVDATEASEDGKTPAHPGYTAGQVRARYAEVKEIRDRVIPAARQALAVRREQEGLAKAAYPLLFKEGTKERGIAESILRQAPGLKAIFPNVHLVIGDALVGERIRLAKAKASRGGPAKAGTPSQPPKAGQAVPAAKGAPKSAPRPGPGLAARAAGRGKSPEVSNKRFMEMGGTRGALVEMLRETVLPVGNG